MRVIVIGAGISGLACATRLVEQGAAVTVLERSERVGGVIASSARNGFLFELGPQSFQLTPALADLVRAAGLESQVVSAPPRAPRYVLARGRLRSVPLGPQILVGGSLLGFGSRLRLLGDLLGRSAPPERDESLAAFVERKFGAEVLDRLAGPFVSGIYAGDPLRLGLRDTFPELYRWEREKGSILRGALAAARSAGSSGRPRPTLSAMREGNASLLEALRRKLGDSVQLGAGVSRVRRGSSEPGEPDSGKPGTAQGERFTVEVDGTAGTQLLTADHVVMAAPPAEAAGMLAGLSPRLAALLGQIEYAPVAVVGTGYRRAQVRHPLVGFGFLVARSENRKLLGTVWMSSLFPGRAPEDSVNLASFVGGATDPAATTLPPEAILGAVTGELGPILGITGAPVEATIGLHRKALPQYNLGHRQRVAEIRAEAERIPGLHLVGNYLEGLATGACVDLAFRAADRIAGAVPARLQARDAVD